MEAVVGEGGYTVVRVHLKKQQNTFINLILDVYKFALRHSRPTSLFNRIIKIRF